MITTMAWRNIWRNKARSLIIMLSIMLGLFAGLSVIALYKGMMKARLRTVIEREVGHLQIHHPKFREDFLAEYILPANPMLDSIGRMPEVKAIARRSVTTGMLSTATGSAGIMVYGIRPEDEMHVSSLDKKIVEGSYFGDGIRNPVLIGKKLAEKMKLDVKSKLVLMLTDSSNTIVSAAFRVAGIYESENAPLDERTAYVPREILNNLLGLGDASHELVILLRHDEDLEQTSSELRSQFPELLVEQWQELSPETQLMTDLTDQYSFIIVVIIMLALAFGVINTMLMAILERIRETGMLVALGMSKMRLFFLILSETIFLTLAGCPPGILLSWLITWYYNRRGIDLTGLSDEALKSFGFSNVVYPEFPYDQVVQVFLTVVITALVSSLLPALKALRLRPMEALRK